MMGGAKFTDWSASIAVLLGFMYAQRSFDAIESLAPTTQEATPLNHEMQKIFVAKEIVWMTTFYALGSYPLVCGALVFAVYPTIRRALRRAYPSAAFCKQN